MIISKEQERIRDLCTIKGPKGGNYCVPGTEEVQSFLRMFRYSKATLEILESSIRGVRETEKARLGIE